MCVNLLCIGINFNITYLKFLCLILTLQHFHLDSLQPETIFEFFNQLFGLLQACTQVNTSLDCLILLFPDGFKMLFFRQHARVQLLNLCLLSPQIILKLLCLNLYLEDNVIKIVRE